jgi:hypothetical protein
LNTDRPKARSQFQTLDPVMNMQIIRRDAAPIANHPSSVFRELAI